MGAAPVTDGARVLALLAGLAEASGAIGTHRVFVVPGPPQPKQRARMGAKGRWFTPDATVHAENYVGLLWRGAQRGLVYDGPIAVAAIFFLPTHRARDADNLLKLVLDAGNRARVWRDDSQVVALASVLDYDHDHPRSVIACCSTTSGLVRTANIRRKK